MDPIPSVEVIPGIIFALMKEMSLEVCQYLKHDMNTWPNSIVSIVTMCLSLEATQKDYTFMVYPSIEYMYTEQMLQIDEKITKVLCIYYIEAHYGFLVIYKVNNSMDIVEQTGGLGYKKIELIETYLEYITNILVVLKWG